MKLKRLGRLSEGLQLEGAFGVGFKTLYALGCTAFFFVHCLENQSISLAAFCNTPNIFYDVIDIVNFFFKNKRFNNDRFWRFLSRVIPNRISFPNNFFN
jgi:hypothetical protein